MLLLVATLRRLLTGDWGIASGSRGCSRGSGGGTSRARGLAGRIWSGRINRSERFQRVFSLPCSLLFLLIFTTRLTRCFLLTRLLFLGPIGSKFYAVPEFALNAVPGKIGVFLTFESD